MHSKRQRSPAAQLALPTTDPMERLVVHWALGMASDVQFCATLKREWHGAHGVLRVLGLSTGELESVAVEQIAERCRGARSELCDLEADGEHPLVANAQRLGDVVGLRPIEVDLLVFFVASFHHEELREALGLLEQRSTRVTARVLGQALGHDPDEVMRALSPRAPLRSLGLLSTDSPRESVPSVSSALANALSEPHASADELAAALVEPASPATRVLADFAHLGETLTLLVRALEAALAGTRRGLGVLTHGASGTGKSELVRVLSANAGARLFTVRVADGDGDPLHPQQRLASLGLTQRLVERGSRNVVLFDEIEDVFPDLIQPLGRVVRRGEQKGFLGKLIEEPPVPTFWLSNEVGQIDPALLRRFDLVVEMRPPPIEARRRIVESALAGLAIGKDARDRVARLDGLTPADVQRAARIVRLIGATDVEDGEAVLRQALSTHVRRLRAEPERREIEYGVEMLGASVDLDTVVRGLERHGRGTLLLHGPPGAGKSAFARHVAERLGRSVMAKNASDLLSKWVGQTEQNLAAAFARAEDEGAVLVLDEVDSFLQGRDRATALWEVTQVNELLVQIERFRGILFATTNGLDRLDAASLRRFAMKIAFEPPAAPARAELFRRLSMAAGVVLREGEAAERMEGANGVVPGDFAAVLAATRLSGDELDGAWLERRLREELMLRNGNRRAVGFGGSRSTP
jgi:SpoVK/Ycf46/Vps4 family AAA+-type ATPase